MQIKDIYMNKYGFYPYQAEKEIEKIKEYTVYELLTIKKELTEREHYQDTTCMHWFRDENRFECS